MGEMVVVTFLYFGHPIHSKSSRFRGSFPPWWKIFLVRQNGVDTGRRIDFP